MTALARFPITAAEIDAVVGEFYAVIRTHAVAKCGVIMLGTNSGGGISSRKWPANWLITQQIE